MLIGDGLLEISWVLKKDSLGTISLMHFCSKHGLLIGDGLLDSCSYFSFLDI